MPPAALPLHHTGDHVSHPEIQLVLLLGLVVEHDHALDALEHNASLSLSLVYFKQTHLSNLYFIKVNSYLLK